MKAAGFCIYVVFLLIPTVLWADAAQTCTVRGRVVNSAGGQPLNDARVQLKSADDTKRFYNVTTGPDGEFVFSQVAPGSYRLLARHNRFVPGTFGQKGDVFSKGSLLTLKPSDELKDIVFRLIPTAAIVGQVFDEDGEPLPAVEVQALIKASKLPENPDAPPAAVTLAPISTALTNDLGQFRLYNLPPGEYFVSAVDSGMPELSEEALTGGFMYELADAPQPKYPPTYYPGTTDSSQAAKIEVRSGGESRVEFHLSHVDTHRVSGRVIDASGRPVQGAAVLISPDDLATEFSSLRYNGDSDANGRFQITSVAPGNYTIEASLREEQKQWIAERSVTVTSDDVAGMELALLPPVKISGRITFQGNASLQPGRGLVWLRSAEDRGHGFGAGEIRKDNTFVVDNLIPGRYTVSVSSLAGESYLAAAHLGTSDVLKSGLTVANTSGAASLDLVINPDGGSIEGVVTRAQNSVSGATVHIECDAAEGARQLSKSEVETDQNGHFVFHALPPGHYTISAEEDDQSGNAAKITVDLHEGGRSNVTLILAQPQ